MSSDLDKVIENLKAEISKLEVELEKIVPYIAKITLMRNEALLKKEVYEENISFITQKGVIMLMDEYAKVRSDLKMVLEEIHKMDTHLGQIHASVSHQKKVLDSLNNQKTRLENQNKKGTILKFYKRKKDD